MNLGAILYARVEGVKLIDLGIALGHQSVALMVGLTAESESRVSIRVQLHPAGGQNDLPPKIRLALLSTSGAILQESIADSQDNSDPTKTIYLSEGKKLQNSG